MESDSGSSSSSSSSGYTSRSSTPDEFEIDEDGFINEDLPIEDLLEPPREILPPENEQEPVQDPEQWNQLAPVVRMPVGI